MNDIQATVNENLDSAIENNPELETWTVSDIAFDMCAYSVDFESYDPEELHPYIEMWKREYRNRD